MTPRCGPSTKSRATGNSAAPNAIGPRFRCSPKEDLPAHRISQVRAMHHKTCQVLGGTFNLPHAQTHAAVLPYVLASTPPLPPTPQAAGIPTPDGLDLGNQTWVRTRIDVVLAPPKFGQLVSSGLPRSSSLPGRQFEAPRPGIRRRTLRTPKPLTWQRGSMVRCPGLWKHYVVL